MEITLRLLRKGLWQMANQQWNVCIPFARSNSSVPMATVCRDGWCSYSNREPTCMFTVKFLSHYLILLLPPSKLLKEGKIRVSLFFEWIKIMLKILKSKDPLQTTGAIICIPGTNCLIPWFPPPHWWGTIAVLLKRELPLHYSMSDVWQSAAPPGPTVFKCSTSHLLSQAFHQVYSVVSHLPPPTISTPLLFWRNTSTQTMCKFSWQLFAST